MYQRVGPSAFKKDLTNITALCKALGDPQEKFRAIHVAGTNGKGSVSHMLASILQEAGYNTGLYTSPHLKDFTERVRINGEPISQDAVVSFVVKNKELFDEVKPSFFEMTVAMAFEHFVQEDIDVAVVETGLGGRFDSTNILIPLFSLITTIGLDHQQFLGDTLGQIAMEKAGIIKSGKPVIVSDSHPETEPVFREKAAEVGAPIYFADQSVMDEAAQHIVCDLKGDYQRPNIKLVMAAAAGLHATGLEIPPEAILNGFAKVRANTGFRGRWEVLQDKPKVIADCGHNVDGISYVVDQLLQEHYKQLHIVWGSVADKDLKPVLELLPNDAKYYFCKPDIPRGLDAVELQRVAKSVSLDGELYDSVNEAFMAAKFEAADDDVVFVGGSTFVVAEVI
jgi:dihydrofolate synthase/folylpolyglutamate synthase